MRAKKKSPGDEHSNDEGEKDNFMITPFGGEKEIEKIFDEL